MNWTSSQVEVMVWSAFIVATFIFLWSEFNRIKHLKHNKTRHCIFPIATMTIVGLVAWHFFIPFAKLFLVGDP